MFSGGWRATKTLLNCKISSPRKGATRSSGGGDKRPCNSGVSLPAGGRRELMARISPTAWSSIPVRLFYRISLQARSDRLLQISLIRRFRWQGTPGSLKANPGLELCLPCRLRSFPLFYMCIWYIPKPFSFCFSEIWDLIKSDRVPSVRGYVHLLSDACCAKLLILLFCLHIRCLVECEANYKPQFRLWTL